MANPTYQDYINTAKSSIAQRILKVEILDSDENIVDTITPKIMGGDIQLSSDSGSRRSCNLTFANDEGDFIPDPDGSFWINTKYKIYTGLKVLDKDYYFSRGIFLSGEPEISSNFSEITTSLQLYDKWCNFNGELSGTLATTYQIPAGTNWETAIRAVMLAGGETKNCIIEPITETVAYTILVQAGGTYSEIIEQLCNMVSYVYYFDDEGYPRFERATNIDTASSIWNFTTNENIYLGSRKRYEYTKVRNSIKVIGSNVNGAIFSGVASDINPSSSTRIALIGERVFVINDENIYSDALCLTRAEFELKKAIQVVESISAECVPIDSITVDSVINIVDSGSGTNDRYLVKSISFPLINSGNMQMQVWNSRSFL